MTSSDAISGSAASPPAPPEAVAPVPEPGTPADGAAEVGTAAPGASGGPVGEPALPEQSREDTDAAWGEYQEPADDHLYRDRPPHWDDF
jgi:hypothetical protein